jgi:hypothetical protein
VLAPPSASSPLSAESTRRSRGSLRQRAGLTVPALPCLVAGSAERADAGPDALLVPGVARRAAGGGDRVVGGLDGAA